MNASTNGKAVSPHESAPKLKCEVRLSEDISTICPIPVTEDSDHDLTVVPSGLTPPRSLTDKNVFLWDNDAQSADNYRDLGQRLAHCDDTYRNPQHASGLLCVPEAHPCTPRMIQKGADLAAIIADRLRIEVFKNGKPTGSMLSSTHLSTMLKSEVFLQQFRALDLVTSNAMYLPVFQLTKCGYNDGGVGQRIFYSGRSAKCVPTFDAIKKFLDVMAFATESDRTNAVAAALTVMLRNFWPGAKPLVVVTSTKSHGGKDTVIDFAAGETTHSSISYERADWALQKNFVALVKQNPDVGVVTIENVRLEGGQQFASAFVERFVTDSNPVLYSTGVGDGTRQPNHWVLAVSTNFGKVSEDMMNRALPIHMKPIGDVAHRESAIGNPRLEYLPANRERIAAELRGMIEKWKSEGQPLDKSARHPCTAWAQTIGGILQVAGLKGFLGNAGYRKTEDDPLRSALGLLGTSRPDEWLRPRDWALVVGELGLNKRVIPTADRDSSAGRERGLGVVLSAHSEESFEVETEDEIVSLRLEKARRRFDAGRVSTRYRFAILTRESIPEDSK